MTNAKDLIMGTSAPAMTFNDVGAEIMGKILTEPKAVQQTVYDPRNPQNKTPAFWPSGDPKMQVIFQVQTQWRNWEGVKNPDRNSPDDGRRTVYLKGKFMEKATAEAVRAVGADWLDVGGMIWYRYIGEDMSSMAGAKPKMFEVRYQPPQGQQANTFGASQDRHSQNYGANGMAGQDYQAQNAPRPPQAAPQAQPAWQQPGWGTGQQQYPVQPAVPSHHGQPDQMPAWAAGPASAPPAPSSAPPAPHLSTLDMIRNGQVSGTPDYGSIEPAF